MFLLLGLAEPLVVRYVGELLSHAGGAGSGAMTAYFGNASTLGTIVVTVIAGLAFSLRSTPAVPAFYLAHVPSRTRLLTPRVTVTALAAGGASLLGAAAATYETTVPLGHPAWGSTLAGAALGVGAVAVDVAVTFAVAAVVPGSVATVGASLGLLLVGVPLLDLIPHVAPAGLDTFLSLPARLQPPDGHPPTAGAN